MADILNPRSPTREELARFLPNQRAIRAFEELFKLVPSEFNNEKVLIQETLVEAGTANAKAVQAIDGLACAERRSRSNGVLTWLSM